VYIGIVLVVFAAGSLPGCLRPPTLDECVEMVNADARHECIRSKVFSDEARGAVIGSGVGASIGAAIGGVVNHNAKSVVIGGLSGAAAGAATGAAIGYASNNYAEALADERVESRHLKIVLGDDERALSEKQARMEELRSQFDAANLNLTVAHRMIVELNADIMKDKQHADDDKHALLIEIEQLKASGHPYNEYQITAREQAITALEADVEAYKDQVRELQELRDHLQMNPAVPPGNAQSAPAI